MSIGVWDRRGEAGMYLPLDSGLLSAASSQAQSGPDQAGFRWQQPKASCCHLKQSRLEDIRHKGQHPQRKASKEATLPFSPFVSPPCRC